MSKSQNKLKIKLNGYLIICFNIFTYSEDIRYLRWTNGILCEFVPQTIWKIQKSLGKIILLALQETWTLQLCFQNGFVQGLFGEIVMIKLKFDNH